MSRIFQGFLKTQFCPEFHFPSTETTLNKWHRSRPEVIIGQGQWNDYPGCPTYTYDQLPKSFGLRSTNETDYIRVDEFVHILNKDLVEIGHEEAKIVRGKIAAAGKQCTNVPTLRQLLAQTNGKVVSVNFTGFIHVLRAPGGKFNLKHPTDQLRAGFDVAFESGEKKSIDVIAYMVADRATATGHVLLSTVSCITMITTRLAKVKTMPDVEDDGAPGELHAAKYIPAPDSGDVDFGK